MNNGKKSDTQKYNYSHKSNRGRRGGSSKLVFIILLSLLILALIAAIALVVVDLVGSAGSTTDGPDSESTAEPSVGTEHSLSHAIDGNSESYMLSFANQSAGSYFSCEFDALADVGEVIVASTHPDYYIRGCEVQLLSGGDWITIGVFGNAAAEKTYTVGSVTLNATAVRILLTSDFDALWALNELTVTDKNGNPVHLKAPFSGTNAAEVPVDTTTPPEATTEVKVEVTEPPVTEPPALGYTTIEMSNTNLYTGSLILVNAQYAYHFPASEARLLTVYNEYVANNYRCNYFDDTSMQLDATATRNILALANALYTETGLNWLKMGTGYRSYEVQQGLADRYPTTAALPGYSEHHTGLGVDLQIWDREKGVTYNFDEPNQNCQTIYSWISANAYKYGYVRRFAPDKDNITYITSDRWHYRYVGVPHAYYMTANNLCLEEYLAWLEGFTYEGTHLFINDVEGKNYEIYFVPAENGTSTTLPVPTDPTAYTVSGNNFSGYIVTVTLN
jgi:D-alanyl-D-alanine carboxypeptidase